jgi:hypothetical protein
MLGRTLLALRRTVAVHDRARVVFVTPSRIGALKLPGGTFFSGALGSLDEDLKVLVKGLLLGPWFDESTVTRWNFAGLPAPGLGEAIRTRGLAVSLDRAPWQQPTLTVHRATRARGSPRTVPNAWQGTIEEIHRAALARHLRVLPAYDNPGTHDPTSPNFDPAKSHLPKNAQRILEHAVPDGNNPWWARCECGFFHRFDGSLQGTRWRVHWNGTTNPKAKQITREESVPRAVRERLRNLEPVRDCGCRET